ncbi:MAG: outer membrane beta-barrel protein [candidate division Zixibacteria bacterium]|nr:outer membrane beta-barrel protein [candidate division Zixibacteria bacterium]
MKRSVIILAVSAMIFMLPVFASAQTDIGLKAFGVKFGYYDPEEWDGTIGFGAVADLGTFIPQLGWEAEIDYWSKSQDEQGAEAKLRDIAFATTAKYGFPTQTEKFTPFIGGGVGLHLMKVEVEYLGQTQDDSETKFDFHFCGGTDVVLTPQIDGFAEIRYSIISDISQLWITIGAKYKLGVY